MVSYVVCYARVNNNSVVTLLKHDIDVMSSQAWSRQAWAWSCVRMSRSFFWYLNRERLVRSVDDCMKLADLMTTMLNNI